MTKWNFSGSLTSHIPLTYHTAVRQSNCFKSQDLEVVQLWFSRAACLMISPTGSHLRDQLLRSCDRCSPSRASDTSALNTYRCFGNNWTSSEEYQNERGCACEAAKKLLQVPMNQSVETIFRNVFKACMYTPTTTPPSSHTCKTLPLHFDLTPQVPLPMLLHRQQSG